MLEAKIIDALMIYMFYSAYRHTYIVYLAFSIIALFSHLDCYPGLPRRMNTLVLVLILIIPEAMMTPKFVQTVIFMCDPKLFYCGLSWVGWLCTSY